MSAKNQGVNFKGLNIFHGQENEQRMKNAAFS